MVQPVLARRQPEFPVAGGVRDVGAPFGQLLPGEIVDIRAIGQVLERLVAGDHDVRGLRPRNVELLVRAELAELEVLRADPQVGQLGGDVRDVSQESVGRQRGEVAMQRAEQADIAGASLRLCLEAILELGRLGEGDELHFPAKAGEDVVADLLLLLDGTELAGQHRDRPRGRGGCSLSRRGSRARRRASVGGRGRCRARVTARGDDDRQGDDERRQGSIGRSVSHVVLLRLAGPGWWRIDSYERLHGSVDSRTTRECGVRRGCGRLRTARRRRWRPARESWLRPGCP